MSALGTVTGYFTAPNGTPVTGFAQFFLSGDSISSTTCCVPVVTTFPVTSGSLSATVMFNDQLTPTGTTYQISVRAKSGQQVFTGKYSLESGTANLNTLIPM